jgi:hypothetical protein
MAKTFIDDFVRSTYNPTIAFGDEVIFGVPADISSLVVELNFPSTGTGTVYTSINSYAMIKTAIATHNDTLLTWTPWSLGTITNASGVKRATVEGVNAVRFANSGGANNIVFNYRGLFGRKAFNDLLSTTYYDNLRAKDVGAFYLGNETTDGSWRFIRSGNNLVAQRREATVWVTKNTIVP